MPAGGGDLEGAPCPGELAHIREVDQIVVEVRSAVPRPPCDMTFAPLRKFGKLLHAALTGTGRGEPPRPLAAAEERRPFQAEACPVGPCQTASGGSPKR
jgi:hypothetical protein